VRPLGGKWRQLVGKVGEWYMASQHLQGCSPHLCQLRTDGLAPMSKYWMYRSHAGVYGPSKPSNRMSTKAWLFPTASLAIVGERMSTDPWIGQPMCCGLCREPFFSGVVDLFKSVDDCAKGSICGPREICMVLDHMWTERGKHVACWSGFPLHGVHRFESSWLSDMSNRLFVVVIT
jgi:hypothetical protein